jgi:hypothetical protein
MGKIIWGIIWIVAGLSGQFVLVGTNSSGALVAVGIGLVIWGLIQTSSKGETRQEQHVPEQEMSALDKPVNLSGSK